MSLKFIIPLFVIVPNFLFGQVLKGRIVDSENQQKSVSYATIIYNNNKNAVNADENGHFSLVLQSDKDTLFIRCVGYISALKIIDKNIKDTILVSLKRTFVQLEEIKIFPSKKPDYWVGSNQKKSNGSFGGIVEKNMQYGYLFNQNSVTNKTITKVGFYITGEGVISTPFRIRIYSFNGNTPSEEILLDNLIVTVTKKGWSFFDISKLQITVPDKGCVVAMEWLNLGDKYKYYDKMTKSFQYGQRIGITSEFRENKGFLKINDGNWVRNDRFYNSFRASNLNPMIQIGIL